MPPAIGTGSVSLKETSGLAVLGSSSGTSGFLGVGEQVKELDC